MCWWLVGVARSCIDDNHASSPIASGVVVLFSNDTQLCSKAIVNNVKAFNSKVISYVMM